MKPFLRIEPDLTGTSTEVTQYKVVDQNGTMHFTGSYTDCYNYLHPTDDLVYRNILEVGGFFIDKNNLY